jgi:hypothetical protein
MAGGTAHIGMEGHPRTQREKTGSGHQSPRANTDNQWKPRPGPSIPIPRRKSDPDPIIIDKYPPPDHTWIYLVGGDRASPLERRVCPRQHVRNMELMTVAHRLNRVFGGICGLFGKTYLLCPKVYGQSVSFNSLPCASPCCSSTWTMSDR